jgi:hypothetical protein
MLGDLTEHLLRRWNGDEAAERDPRRSAGS